MEHVQELMNKQQIELLLRFFAPRVSFQSQVKVEKRGEIVILTLQDNGLIANMQSDAAAFESWALVIKSAFEKSNASVRVRIDGNVPDHLLEKDKKHYNRFLYRLSKFTEFFSWAYTEDFKNELSKFKEQHSHIVINVPKPSVPQDAEKGEAIMERYFCEDNKSSFDCFDHQLPVRIFDERISKLTAITAGGFIDAWGIKGDTIYVFELKLDNNRKVGAISELMFYVNIIHDLLTHKITIPGTSNYRSFNILKDYYDAHKCKKIVGRIIAQKYHPLIPITSSVIKEAFDNYPSPISIEIDTDIDNYINEYKLRDMSLYIHTDYLTKQKENQLDLLHSGFFGKVEGYGCWWDSKTKSWKNYPQILTHQDSLANLYAPIRQKALKYFEFNDIAWWRQDEDRYFPSGHLLSSQNHCLNRLFALRADKDALLAIIQAQLPDICEILPSPIDEKFCCMKKYPYKIPSYISFEFSYENVMFLNERCNKRGANCTSVDAFVYAKDNDGKYVLIPIEWKYTETYKKTKDKKIKQSIIEDRYFDKIDLAISHLEEWQDSYYWDPHYELARQSLLMEQIIKNQPFGADYYHHMVVCPAENTKMWKDALSFKASLTETGQKLFHILDPQQLLAPLEGNTDYKDLLNYLKTRYWHE